MSTRCNIVIKETEGKFFQLYHHCDGYPAGVGLELEDYLKQMSPVCLTCGEDVVDFLCSEDNEYEYEGAGVSIHGDIDYLYIIDLHKNTIVCYNTWLTGTEDIDELIINDKIDKESKEATFVYMTRFKSEVSEVPVPAGDAPIVKQSVRTIENVWHRIHEYPEEFADIVLVDSHNQFLNINYCSGDFDDEYDGCYGWNNCVSRYNVKLWAYLEEILPEGSEK